MNLFREAVARWYQAPLRRRPGPGERGPHPHRLQRGHRPSAPGDQRPRGHQSHDHPGLPGVPAWAPCSPGLPPFLVPLYRENSFLPDFKEIPPLEARDAKLFFFNYPNNPTAAVADKGFFQGTLEFCQEYQIVRGARRGLHRTGLRRLQAPQLPGTARGQRHRHRIPFPVQDLQHDGLAPGDGGGEPGSAGGPGQDQEQHRFRGLQRHSDGRHRRPGFGPELRPAENCAISTGTPGPPGLRPKEAGL